jgi:hypothetical protein
MDNISIKSDMATVLSQITSRVSNTTVRRFLIDLGRKGVSLNRKRIQNQKNVDGGAFEKPKSGKKALRKILKGKKSHKFIIGEKTIRVESTVPFAGEHQLGRTRTINSKNNNAKNKTKNNDYCSKKQAKYLKTNWTGVWRAVRGTSKKKRKTKKPKMTWLQSHFSAAFAGYLISKHKKSIGTHKKEWKVKLPVRHVLGLGKEDVKILTKYFIEKVNKIINKV